MSGRTRRTAVDAEIMAPSKNAKAEKTKNPPTNSKKATENGSAKVDSSPVELSLSVEKDSISSEVEEKPRSKGRGKKNHAVVEKRPAEKPSKSRKKKANSELVSESEESDYDRFNTAVIAQKQPVQKSRNKITNSEPLTSTKVVEKPKSKPNYDIDSILNKAVREKSAEKPTKSRNKKAGSGNNDIPQPSTSSEVVEKPKTKPNYDVHTILNTAAIALENPAGKSTKSRKKKADSEPEPSVPKSKKKSSAESNGKLEPEDKPKKPSRKRTKDEEPKVEEEVDQPTTQKRGKRTTPEVEAKPKSKRGGKKDIVEEEVKEEKEPPAKKRGKQATPEVEEKPKPKSKGERKEILPDPEPERPRSRARRAASVEPTQINGEVLSDPKPKSTKGSKKRTADNEASKEDEEPKEKKSRSKSTKKNQESASKNKESTSKSKKTSKAVENNDKVDNGESTNNDAFHNLDPIQEDDEEPEPKVEPKVKKGRTTKKTTKEIDEDNNETDGPQTSKEPKEKKAKMNSTTTNYEDIDFSMAKEFNLKISSWNVAGLRSWLTKDGLKYIQHEKPDIFCLQEIKCEKEKLPEESRITGYHPYWLCNKGGYAGVAIYSKIMPINVEYGIGDSEQDEDGRIITAEYEKFFLISVYVPNSGRGLVTLPKRLRWNKLFKDYISKLNEKKPVIIAGDMNVSHQEIDLARPKTNKKSAGFTQEERDGMTDFLSTGFVDTFRHFYKDKEGAYTYWTYMANSRSKNVGWRLDYFLVSERIITKIVDNVIRNQVMGSDHCPITLFANF